MASLSVSQSITLIKTPKNAREILRARQKRWRNRLHTETETECDEMLYLLPHHQRFLGWVKNILQSDENYKRFVTRYRPPLATNEFTESIFSQFEKVFESENKYEKFNFTDPDLEPDFQQYRKNMGDFTFWETQGFETMKNSIENILVCDLPAMDATVSPSTVDDNYPQPYYYFLDIDNVIDIENVRVKATDYQGNDQNYFFKTEYVIFWEDPKTVCVFDDGFFRKFAYSLTAGGDPVLLSEVAHDLGYCPARSFWTTPLNSKSTILKRSPITTSLSKLDELLIKDIFSDTLKDYASFPIYVVYEAKCTYKDKAQNIECRSGFLYNTQLAMGTSEKSNVRCPKCSQIKTAPGSILKIVTPQTKDDFDMMANPLKVISADVNSVKLNEESIDALKESIFCACVGGGIEADDNQAKNEDQVQAAFEGKTNKLLWIKKNFEAIHSFAMDTVGRLRYGDQYLSSTIDYGDVFFQKDETVEMESYVEAKEQEFPAFDLAIRRDSINDARYRNNPDMTQRLKILSNLDPFPDDDIVSLVVLLDNASEIIDPIEVCIKVHFDKFIKRFEREQAPLLVFGSKLDFDKKIVQIQTVLHGYATDYLATRKINAVTYPIVPPPPVPVEPVIRVKGEPAPAV